MPRFEDLDLRLHTGILDHLGHLAQMRGRVHEHSFAEIHCAAVQRADVGAQFQHMAKARLGTRQCRAGTSHLGVVIARNEACTLARGQVDQDVAISFANTLHNLAEIGRIARTRAVGLAHMNMRDRSARLAGLDCFPRDLFGRNRKVRMILKIHVSAGQCGGHDRFLGHGSPCWMSKARDFARQFNGSAVPCL